MILLEINSSNTKSICARKQNLTTVMFVRWKLMMFCKSDKKNNNTYLCLSRATVLNYGKCLFIFFGGLTAEMFGFKKTT